MMRVAVVAIFSGLASPALALVLNDGWHYPQPLVTQRSFAATGNPQVNGLRERLSEARENSHPTEEKMRIGIMSDLNQIVKMAHDEFQSGYDDPIQKFGLWLVLWIGFYLRLNYSTDRDHTILIYEYGSDLCGMVEISMQPRLQLAAAMPPPQWVKRLRGELTPYLSNLLVTKRHRRRGIGRALVRGCEAFVQHEWHGQSLSLHFDAVDVRLSKFYQRLGYKFQSNPKTRMPVAATSVNGFDLCYASKQLSGREPTVRQ